MVDIQGLERLGQTFCGVVRFSRMSVLGKAHLCCDGEAQGEQQRGDR
jgi:hypothetical protein